jgi:hypothetical protein
VLGHETGRLGTVQYCKIRVLLRSGTLANGMRETVHRPALHMQTRKPQVMHGRHIAMLRGESDDTRESLDAPTEAACSAGRILLTCGLGLSREVILLRILLLALLFGARLWSSSFVGCSG